MKLKWNTLILGNNLNAFKNFESHKNEKLILKKPNI